MGFGGIERLVYDLVLLQNQRKKFNVSIGAAKANGEFQNQYKLLGDQLKDFNLNSGFDINPFKINSIYSFFKKNDIIHLHGFHITIVLAAVLSGKKIIYTEHGNFAFGRKIKFMDRLSLLMRKFFFKFSNTLICCNSVFTMNYVSRNFYSGKRLMLVYNGINMNDKIDKNLFLSLKEKYKNKFVIGTSVRLAGFKKVDRLIYVFSEFVKYHQNALLVIVGDGIERKKLEELVLKLKIEQHTIFEGFIEKVNVYQSMFDVAIFSSENEPFGLVALECYSKKKPVLVFNDGGGITEIVENFEPKDICPNFEYMINRLKYYRNNNFKFSTNHLKKLDYFNLKRMENEYKNVYMEELNC